MNRIKEIPEGERSAEQNQVFEQLAAGRGRHPRGRALE